MSTMMTTSVRIARRPIHDRDLQVVAYEARYASAGKETPVDAGELFVSSMVDIGLDRLGSGHPVVVTLPDEVVRSGTFAHLPLDRLLLDIPGSSVVDDELEGVIRSSIDQGLRIRLADPVEYPQLESLAEVAAMIAVDVSALGPDERRKRRAQLRAPGRLLLATGVDDHALHADAFSAQYDLFTGTVLSTPNTILGTHLPTDRVALLNLIATLNDNDVSVDSIESAVNANPALSYQLLRYVNSAFVGLRTEVDSVRRAVVLVGPPILRQLASMLLLQATSDRPKESSRIALIRAEMCAAIAEKVGDARPAYHTAGLLSAVDLLTDAPLEDAIAELPLTHEVSDALLHHDGRIGRVLQAVKLYERADWDDPVISSFDPLVLSEAYFRAVMSAEETLAVVASMAE